MALIEQWRSKRSIVVDGLVALAGGAFGLGALIPGMVPPAAQGTLSAPRENWENPVRARIMSTLNRSPGIHFRELQRSCLLYTSPSPRDVEESRMPSSA